MVSSVRLAHGRAGSRASGWTALNGPQFNRAIRPPAFTRPARAAAAGNGDGPTPDPAPDAPAPLVMPRLDITAETTRTIPAPPPLRVLRPPPPGAKKPRDVNFWGKMAVLALAATLIGERVTGAGAVQALDLAVGVPLWEIDIPVAGVVGGCLLGALTPPPAGWLRRATPASLARGFLYRLAFFLLAAVLVCEVGTGKGALSFFELETGVGEVGEIEAFTLFVGLLFLVGDYSTGEEEGRGGGGGAGGGMVG